MDVSLAKGKSHFSSVAGAVKHMQPFKASPSFSKVRFEQLFNCFFFFIIVLQEKVFSMVREIFLSHRIALL